MTFKKILLYLRKNYIVGISGFVALACLVVFLVRSGQITRLMADYDDLSVRRTRILKNLRFGSEIEPDLEKMKSMSKAVDSRLFHPADLASNQRYFYQIESATGVALTSLQQIIKPLPSGKKNKKARHLAEKSKYQEIVYDMGVSGTYEEILAFLREIEGGDAFVCLGGFSVVKAADSEKGALVSMRLTVEVLGNKS